MICGRVFSAARCPSVRRTSLFQRLSWPPFLFGFMSREIASFSGSVDGRPGSLRRVVRTGGGCSRASRDFYATNCHLRSCGPLTNRYIQRFSRIKQASVAQLAEQLICNQQVVGSSPSASSWRVRSGPLSCLRIRSRARVVRKRRCTTGCRKMLVPNDITVNITTSCGGFPERSKGSDCKSDGIAFTGSNPVPPT